MLKFNRWIAVAALAIPSITFAADFKGNFTDAKLSVELTPAADGKYAGSITLNGQHFPLKATAEGSKLAGTFIASGTDFAFSATLEADRLTLVSEGHTYTLDRPATVVKNPLATDAPVNPLAAAGDSASSDVTVLAATDSGKTLFFQKPKTTSAADALQAVLPDLAKVLGDRPKVSTAFADTKQATRGMAQFTATVNGKPVEGVILCGGGEKGEVVSVIYAATKAPPAEWVTLQAALPRLEKMTTLSFPDGTGSIDLPQGWECLTNSVDGGVAIKGPKDQLLAIGRSIGVQTPDSPLMQMFHQNQASARRLGMQVQKSMPGIFVCEFSSPADSMKVLVPQYSEASQANHGPAIRLDTMLEVKDTKANTNGGKAQQLTYTWFKGTGSDQVHYKSICQGESMQIGNGAWMFYFTELAAPEKTFDVDAMTMYAIAQSLKVDMPTLQRVQSEKLQATAADIRENQKRSFDQQQKAHQEQLAGYDRYNQAWKSQEVAKSRSNADFIEVIRGYRSVEDTTTGDKTSVDLGNVNGVVDKLNETDPGRYKQIPLRDEMYPK